MILRNVHALIFTDDAALKAAAEAASQDPRLSRSRVKIIGGGVLDAAEHLASHPSPDVLIVHDAVDDEVWTRLEKLADSVESHCHVVVAGPRDSVAIYREMVGRGVADYIGGEIEPREIADCICRQFSDEDATPKGKLVVVVSAVGGAGGSTVAAVLASDLAKRYGDAVLMDLDLPMGTSALMLAVDPREPLANALANPGLDAAMIERFMAREGGVRVLSTPGSLREIPVLDADIIEHLVGVVRGMTKVTVVDLPKGWGEAYGRLVTVADEIVLVSSTDLASLRNCRMIVEDVAGRRVDGRRPRLVVNRVGLDKKNEYGVADFTESGGTAPAAMVPFDCDALHAAVADGRPLSDAGGKAMPILLAFARTVLAQEAPKAVSAKLRADPLGSLRAALAKLSVKKQKA